MPIVIPDQLPATKILNAENIFTMDLSRARSQNIRPLEILVVNLMPTKIKTETQLAKVLSNTPLQVKLTLLKMTSHESVNTDAKHLEIFYKSFADIKNQNYDGMIITGAPVEMLDFEQVDYYDELVEIMNFSKKHVYSTLHICWGAQVALYHHYHINKYIRNTKLFGIYRHKVLDKTCPLVFGFDDYFSAPVSRLSETSKEEIKKCDNLHILAESKEAGVFLIATDDGRQIFVTGHIEYDKFTLQDEYLRDLKKGLNIQEPYHYYKTIDGKKEIDYCWKAHGYLLFSNWLNYYVYQTTPYNLDNI